MTGRKGRMTVAGLSFPKGAECMFRPIGTADIVAGTVVDTVLGIVFDIDHRSRQMRGTNQWGSSDNFLRPAEENPQNSGRTYFVPPVRALSRIRRDALCNIPCSRANYL